MIEKKFCRISEKRYHPVEDERGGQQFMLSGLLGILNICGYNFLVGITEKELIAKIEGSNIYLIKRVELVPFQNNLNVQAQGFN